MALSGPVTVTAAWRIGAGAEPTLHDWLDGMMRDAKSYAPSLSVTAFRPADPAIGEYIIVYHFAHAEERDAWERSDARRAWLDRAAAFRVGPQRRTVVTGLETWFAVPGRGNAPPPRYKTIVVAALALYPVSLAYNLAIAPWLLPTLPALARPLATGAVLLAVMQFLVMPRVAALAAPYLYRRSHERVRHDSPAG